jgi:hypothetical protein
MKANTTIARGALLVMFSLLGCSDSQSTEPARPVARSVKTGLLGEVLGFSEDLLGGTFSYASTLAFYADTGIGKKYLTYDGGLFEIDGTVTYNGRKTLRYNQPGGSARSPQLEVPLKKALSNVWIRAKIRWSPGYTTKGILTNSSNGYKIFGWGWSGYDGRGTFDLTNTTEYQASWDVRRITGGAIGPFAWGSAGGVRTEWTDGGWYDYVVNFEILSSTQTRTRVWISKDGETPVLRTSFIGTSSGTTVPQVNRVHLGQNFNQVRESSKSQALWYGEWQIVNGVKYADPFGLDGSTSPVYVPPSELTGGGETDGSSTGGSTGGETAEVLPPPPPPPPSGTAPFAGATLAQTFQFESTEAFLNAATALRYGTRSRDLFAIDETVQYNGHKTLRYNQPGGTSRSPELVVPLPYSMAKVWVRAKIRWSTGYTTMGKSDSYSRGYGVLGWGWESGIEGSGSLYLTNTNQYQTSWYAKYAGGSGLGPFVAAAAGHIQNEWTDGAWYDYIVCVERISNTDTRTRVWIAKDGQVPVLRANLLSRTYGATSPRVNRVQFGREFNQERLDGMGQALWFGQWEVVDGSRFDNPYGLQ